jgi:hypothetical protein
MRRLDERKSDIKEIGQAACCIHTYNESMGIHIAAASPQVSMPVVT